MQSHLFYPPGTEDRGYSILLVDDDPANLAILEQQVHIFAKRNNIKVEIATAINGDIAIEQVIKKIHQKKVYNIIVMDFQMEGKNGAETSQIIFGEEEKIKKHSVIVSHSATNLNENRFAKKILPKPLHSKDFFPILTEAFLPQPDHNVALTA